MVLKDMRVTDLPQARKDVFVHPDGQIVVGEVVRFSTREFRIGEDGVACESYHS